MTKCVLSAWNLKIHNTTALNALNWNVYEINSKMTLSMATYSRVVSWSRKRSPLCSSTSWRPGSASSRRVYQGLKNTGPEDCTLCIIMGNIYIYQIAKDKNECFQWMPQRNEHLCCPSVLEQHWKFPFPFVQVFAKEEMILVPLLFHQRLKRSPWEKCKCSWTSSGNRRRLLFCKWQLGHHWEKFRQV